MTSNDLKNFLIQDEIKKLRGMQLFIALMWWHYKQGDKGFILSEQLCAEIESVGLTYDKNNWMRFRARLVENKDVDAGLNLSAFRAKRLFKIKLISVKKYDEKYGHLLNQETVEESDSYFELNQFKIKDKGYIYKVVLQINASYKHNLFDCCAVMIRRLLETLIIEIYEAKKRESEIKDENNRFLMFSKLLTSLHKINVSNRTIGELESFKKIADKSAHDRHYLAKRNHLQVVKQNLNLAVTALLNQAFPKSSDSPD